jgi:hypothetical protein
MTRRLEIALDLVARGIRLFPVRRDGTKRPAHKGWQSEATTDAEQIRQWVADGYNLAIATEHFGADKALVEVDVDVRDGKPGRQSLETLQLRHGDLPPTFTVETPTGGLHYAYAVDTPLKSDTRGRTLGQGIDVKSRGGYVLAPGSTLAGGEYRIIDDRPIAPAPQWLVDLIGVAPPKSERTCEVLPGVVPERAQARAVDYLQHRAPLAIEGQGGNRTTYDIATMLGDYGVDEDTALGLMLEHWNERNSPPWSPDELAEPVGNAYQYREEPVGCLAPEAQFEPYVYDGPLLYTARRWLDRDLPPPDFLLGNLFSTTSRAMLVGPTGAGKSNVGLAIAFPMAAGRDFLHWRAHRAARCVLYIDGEMSARVARERIREASKRHGGLPDNLVIINRDDFPDLPPLNTPAGQQYVDRLIGQIGGVDFVIFDNVQALIGGSMVDEEAWAAVLPWVRDLTRRAIGQLWAHHTGHDESRSYGTKTREWQLDTVMLMEKASTDCVDFVLKFTKARERSPQNRGDFAPTRIWIGDDDQWHSLAVRTANSAKQDFAGPSLDKNATRLWTALEDLTLGGGSTTTEAWIAEFTKRHFAKSSAKRAKNAFYNARGQIRASGLLEEYPDGRVAQRLPNKESA